MEDTAGKKLAKKQTAKIMAYQRVFEGPDGQVVLDDLIKTHYILGSTFDGDTNKTIFREGERNVVLRILGLLKVDAKALQERIRFNENSLE